MEGKHARDKTNARTVCDGQEAMRTHVRAQLMIFKEPFETNTAADSRTEPTYSTVRLYRQQLAARHVTAAFTLSPLPSITHSSAVQHPHASAVSPMSQPNAGEGVCAIALVRRDAITRNSASTNV